MDINCAHDCHYQHEGKCSLNGFPDFTDVGAADETDCPYYARV